MYICLEYTNFTLISSMKELKKKKYVKSTVYCLCIYIYLSKRPPVQPCERQTVEKQCTSNEHL